MEVAIADDDITEPCGVGYECLGGVDTTCQYYLACLGLPLTSIRWEWWSLGCRYTFLSNWLGAWRSYVSYSTYILTIVQIVLFYSVSDQRTRFGWRVPLIAGREYGVLSYVLAHVDELHLWGNMLSQLIAGVIVEGFEGTLRLQVVYWTSAVAAAGFEVALFTPTVARPSIVLLGASGAIYGITLVGLAIAILNRRLVIFPCIIYTLYAFILLIQLLMLLDANAAQNVAHGAHFAGSICGLLVGLAIGRNLRVFAWEQTLKLISGIVAAIAILTVLFLAFMNYD